MKGQKITMFFILSLLVLMMFPGQSQAAGLVPCGGTGQSACNVCFVFVLINNIIHWVLYVLTPMVAVLMFIVGGMYFLVAAGNPALFTKAKSILMAATIGLVIIFVAWVFLNTFLSFIGVAQWTGLQNWWQISCQ